MLIKRNFHIMMNNIFSIIAKKPGASGHMASSIGVCCEEGRSVAGEGGRT